MVEKNEDNVGTTKGGRVADPPFYHKLATQLAAEVEPELLEEEDDELEVDEDAEASFLAAAL